MKASLEWTNSFKSVGQIPDDEKMNIIKTGFQLHPEGKISLKKYKEIL